MALRLRELKALAAVRGVDVASVVEKGELAASLAQHAAEAGGG
jgi:hypothetical protein